MQRVVGIINEEAERLDYLIHNLLDFSQLETGRKKYNRRAIPIEVLWELLSAFALKQAGAHLELECKKLDTCKVDVDPKAIEQALAILIDNARKYGEGDQRLLLGADMKRNQFRVYLRDFGPGIAAKDQKIIFEKFVRIGNLEEHNVRGHGIRLSIARAIIKDHDGVLELKSAAGEGATFSICLPCIQELVQ